MVQCCTLHDISNARNGHLENKSTLLNNSQGLFKTADFLVSRMSAPVVQLPRMQSSAGTNRESVDRRRTRSHPKGDLQCKTGQVFQGGKMNWSAPDEWTTRSCANDVQFCSRKNYLWCFRSRLVTRPLVRDAGLFDFGGSLLQGSDVTSLFWDRGEVSPGPEWNQT